MRSLFIRFAVLFYLAVTLLLCVPIILFAARKIPLEEVHFVFIELYNAPTVVRVYVALAAGAVIFLSFLFERIIIARQQKERTIAFDNPSGRVSVSLKALEDLVRKIMGRQNDVKEVRSSSIIATKKGLEVETRLFLRADVSIPELTSKLQELIKDKIQETIGIEENINVKIHVLKIVTDAEIKSKRTKDGEIDPKVEPNVPFQGYRA